MKQARAHRSLGNAKNAGRLSGAQPLDFTKNECLAMGRRNLIECPNQPARQLFSIGVLFGIARTWPLFACVTFEQVPPSNGRAQMRARFFHGDAEEKALQIAIAPVAA